MSNRLPLDGVLERLDAATAEHFGDVTNVDPHETFRRFDPLLGAVFKTMPITGPFTPAARAVQDAAQRLHEFLPKLTYCVASYWTPVKSGGRHSTCHRRLRPKADASIRPRAAAALFFAISHNAGYHVPYNADKLYTATHFLVEFASCKRSLPIEFSGNVASIDMANCWRVPAARNAELLAKLGWEGILAQLTADFEKDTQYADRFMRKAIAHFEERARIEPEKVGADAISKFTHAMRSLPDLLQQLGRPCANGLREMWECDVTDEQAAFMVASYLLWKEAVPGTEWAYTFPCRVEDTVCVLTAGANCFFDQTQTALMSWLSKTLFLHPLVHDYATIVSGDRIREARETMRKAFGHNVPNVLTKPTIALLKDIQCNLDEALKVARPDAFSLERLTELLTAANRSREVMGLVLEHYRTSVAFLSDPVSQSQRQAIEEALKLNSQDFNLRIIAQDVHVLFMDVARHHCGLEDAVENAVRLEFVGFEGSHAGGNRIIIREFLLNLVKNAARHLDHKLVEKDPNLAVIQLSFHKDASGFGVFSVQDRAGGFDDLASITEAVEAIRNAPEDDVEATAMRFIDAKAVPGIGEFTFGTGLLVTACYLRQLAFSSVMRRPGFVVIKNEQGGAHVSMYFPLVNESPFPK